MSAAAGLGHALRRRLTPTARAARRGLLPHILPRTLHSWPERLEQVRVVGLLSSSSGLGRSARLCMDVLGRAGYGVGGVDVSGLYTSNDGIRYDETRRSGRAQVSIYHLNPPMLLPGIVRSNPLRFLQTFNVGYWAWELETLPREWIDAIRFVDAVMVPSTFCHAAVARHTSKPVVVVPHPVPIVAPRSSGSRSERFRVLSVFNFGSSFERKNPVAAVRAFREAFGSDPSVELVLKVSDGKKYPKDRERLVAEIDGADNVRLIDEVWDQGRLDALVASSDVYLSLHRSEGYGLTIVEAILAGVPVVATGWSGNVDFCHPDLCSLVDHDLVPVIDSHLCFEGTFGAVWAEPSVAHASMQLRALRDDESGARRKAARLREHLCGLMAARTYGHAFERLAVDARGRAGRAPP